MSQATSTSVPRNVLNERIEAFAEAVSLPVEKVREALQKRGIDGSTDASCDRSLTLLENRDFLTFADLCETFVDTGLISKPILRFGLPHLSGSSPVADEKDPNEKIASSIAQLVENSKTVDKMTDEELLKKYDERDSKVAKELADRSRGLPFIVFKDDDTTDVETSLKLLKITKTNGKSISVYNVGDRLKRVYRAGFYTEKPVDVSPFFPSEILVEDYCEKSDTNWSGIDYETRVLAHLQYSHMEKSILSDTVIKQIFEDAKQGAEHFKKKYRKAAMVYRDLEASDELPKLKVKPNQKRIDHAGL